LAPLTIDQFSAKYQNGYWDYDGAYGAQCVDLFNFYNRDVVGAPFIQVSYAYQLYSSFPAPASTYYDKVPAGSVPSKGDVAVWSTTLPGSGGAGHVAVVMGVVDSTHLLVIEQNSPTGAKTLVENHSTSYLLGYLHPKFLPRGGNLVGNGGFESGGWSRTGAGTNMVVYSNGQVSGESARDAVHYLATNTNGGSVYTDVPLSTAVPGTYCGSAWVRTQYPATGAAGTLSLWLLGGAYQEQGLANFSGLSNGTNWRQVTSCVTSTTPHTTLRVEFYPTPGTPTLEIDDVDIH